MADPVALRTCYFTKATLTATPQSIWTLLNAFYTTKSISMPHTGVKQLNLKADAGNSTNNCLIGDEFLTTSNYGDQLQSTAADRWAIYGPFDESAVPLDNIFALASGGSPNLLIAVIV